LLVGKWKFNKQIEKYYEDGVPMPLPGPLRRWHGIDIHKPSTHPVGPISVNAISSNIISANADTIALVSVQFNSDKTGIAAYNIGQPPFTYKLSDNQVSIDCPGYSVIDPASTPNNPYMVTLSFSGLYDVTVTKTSLTLFVNETGVTDAHKKFTYNRTIYFSKE
jgi:hypothetical protein